MDGDRYNIRDKVLRSETSGKGQSKSEVRSSKSETSTNAQNTNDRNKINLSKFPIEDLVVENKIPQTGNRKQKKGSGIWDLGSGKQELKSEILSTKSETNPNDQNPNGRNKKAMNSKNGEYLNDSELSERMTSFGELNDKSGKFSNDSEQSEQMTISGTSLHSTLDIINALKNNQLPDQIMINTHPQRWTDNFSPWVKELVLQNLKNVVKKVLVKKSIISL